MKKLLLTFFLTLIATPVFAGGEQPQQGLIHKHVPLLYTYACVQLPPEEDVAQARPTLPPSIMLPAYIHKKNITEKPAPWENCIFKNSEHFWLSHLKKRQNEFFPVANGFMHNEDCARSFINHTQTPHSKALIAASYWGDSDSVRNHLNAQTNIHNTRADINFCNNIALKIAAENGHTGCVALLLERGAHIHTDNDYALQAACFNGQDETVRFLLEHGANKNAYEDGEADKDSLYWAARAGHTSILALLREQNDLEALNRALTVATEHGQRETVKTLVEQHADIHVDDDVPFRKACENGHTELARFLLSHGADMHALHDDALTSAARNGRADTVQFLLNQGEISGRVKDWVLIATIGGSKEINDPTEHIATLAILLASGADIHTLNDRAIRDAIHQGDDIIITFLINNGASKQAAGEAELERERRFERDPNNF